VLTVNGRVELRRRWWHSASEGSSAPADRWVNSREATVTAGVVEMACRLNNDAGSHDRAAENLFRTGQIRMSGEKLRQLVQEAGRAVLEAQRAAAIPTAFTAEDCPADPADASSPTRVYAGLDGVMVPTITDEEKVKRREKVRRKRQRSGRRQRPLPPRRKGTDERFKEFKVIEFHDETKSHWHVALVRARWPRVGRAVVREARRIGWKRADERVAVVDGAPRIRVQLEADPYELPLDGLGLDFYHLTDNLEKSRRIVFGETSEAGRTWLRTMLHEFRHHGYATAYESLLTWRSGLRGARRAEATRLVNYVQDRRDMLDYPGFARRGWQIGSGPTESRCKTATTRLKGRGRRWDPANAEAVAALTNLMDSGQWRHFWTSLEQTTT